MRLLHYTKAPFTFDREHKYDSKHWKPCGLWVSVEGEADWPSWCQGEEWGTESLAHVTEVTLEPDANILLLDSHDMLAAFDRRYGNGDQHDCRSIRWSEVRALYGGVIIAPYQWSLRLELMWYYGWDCASGVIWNLSAVASTKPAVLQEAPSQFTTREEKM